jgi:hypothetical protein
MTNKQKIQELLTSNDLFSINRIGGLETIACFNYLTNNKNSKDLIRKLKINAGFYFDTTFEFSLFCEHCLAALSNSTLIAFWNSKLQKKLFEYVPIKVPQINLRELEPFWSNNQWLTSNVKKKVIVVSPFSNSINLQIPKLEFIFYPGIYHNIIFSTIQAPLTNGMNVPERTYFENVSLIFNNIIKEKPDFVLLGCGSYGLVLSNILRENGISSIVVGGSLQLFFGIKGSRWEAREDYNLLFNDFWINPSVTEKPSGSNLIEGGCYW